MKEGWYCSVVPFGDDKPFDFCDENNCENCPAVHRKHPTHEQFREEYGRAYGERDGVYLAYRLDRDGDSFGEFRSMALCTAKWTISHDENIAEYVIICACTPYGKPDGDDFEVTE